MDKIGSYIHYQYSNYQKYGIGTRYSPKPGSPYMALQQQRENIKEQAFAISGHIRKQQVKQEIEQKLNFFKIRNGASLNLSWSDKEIQDIENYIHKIIQDKLGLSAFDINWDTLDVYTDNAKASIGNGLKTLGEVTEWNDVEAVKNRMAKLKEYIEKTNGGLQNGSSQDSIQLLDRVKNLWKTYEEIKKDLTTKTIKRYSFQSRQVEENVVMGKFGNNFIKELNQIWLENKKGISSYLKGEVGEMYAAMIDEIVKAKEAGEAKKILTEFESDLNKSLKGMVGKKTSAALLNVQNFAITGKLANDKTDPLHFLNGTGFSSFSGGKAELHYTQDKVDLEMILAEPLGDGMSNIANLSIKNYSMGHGIGVLQGTSLLKLIQDYPNFVNHYLNITAVPKEKRDLNGPLIMANAVLKQTIALRAIAGGIWKASKNGGIAKNQEAQILLLNGEDGYYRVYFIDDIINAILKDDNLITISGINKQTTWDNKWMGTNSPDYKQAYSRINNLLAQLNSFKYKVQISNSIFK